jgi:DNA modification methylase
MERNRFAVAVQHTLLDGIEVQSQVGGDFGKAKRSAAPRRCNDLCGDEWLRNSLSIWSDIRKTPEEAALRHPAMFPAILCERLIMTLLRRTGKQRVLDPFMGSGSTLVAARGLGKVGIGFEISPEFVAMASRRLEAPTLFRAAAPEYEIHQADARRILEFVKPCSVDLCITSPPYWDILNQRRTADGKEIRNYGNLSDDLGAVSDYQEFLQQLAQVFRAVFAALRSRAYCVVVVMDLRKKATFYPYHSDLASHLSSAGFLLDDIIIWDRRQEYNNLRPLGYPHVFRVNKVHEFILLFRKPPG